MAPREQVKFNIFESRVDEGMLEQYRHKFDILKEYRLHTTDKKAHEPYLDGIKMVVYQDQMEGGLRFPLDPLVKLFFEQV